MKINYPLLDCVFHGVSGDYQKIVSDFATNYGFFSVPETAFKILIHRNRVIYAEVSEGGGNTRLSAYFLRDNIIPTVDIDYSPKDIYRRIDIPTCLLKGSRKRLFTVYQIRFAINDPLFDSESSMPLKRGYIGITKRHFFKRFREHEAKAIRGNGHLLHIAWKSLIDSGIDFSPVVQLVGFADDLDGAYEMEEDGVARMTRHPIGLNAIDGGYAGIRELHRLGLLARENRIPVDERNIALDALDSVYSKSPHYRRGHIRKLQSNRSTWVSPCWVNKAENVCAA